MTSPILMSICVPTYNRAETLESCLHMLCPQVAQRSEPIEVVVCDNASTDRTAEVVRQAQELWSFVRYFRNEENIGMLRNIDRVVRHAAGELCWLFGDDDIALPYALDRIVEMVGRIPDRSRFGFGCTNAFLLDPEGQRFLATSDRHCRLPSTVLEHGGDIFAHLDYHSLGHITRLIVNRAQWTAYDYEQREPFEVFSFVRLLILIARDASTFYLAEPVVGGRAKHSTSYYTNHLPLAFIIEFPNFDRLCMDQLGLQRKQLRVLMKERRNLTIRAAIKMLLFQAEYSSYLHYLEEARFSLRSERVVVRLLWRMLSGRSWLAWPRWYVERRQSLPVSLDRSLHSSV